MINFIHTNIAFSWTTSFYSTILYIYMLSTPSILKYNTLWLFLDKIREMTIDACTLT